MANLLTLIYSILFIYSLRFMENGLLVYVCGCMYVHSHVCLLVVTRVHMWTGIGLGNEGSCVFVSGLWDKGWEGASDMFASCMLRWGSFVLKIIIAAFEFKYVEEDRNVT